MVPYIRPKNAKGSSLMKRILATAMILVGASVMTVSADAADPKAKAAAKPAAKPAKKPEIKSSFVQTKLKVVERAPPTFWGDGKRVLDPILAGPWASKFAMRKGYITRLIKRACDKHKGVCPMLQDAQKAI